MGKVIARPPRRKLSAERIPPLQNGSRLTRDEFERLYEAMPELKKAELIEGVVRSPSPLQQSQHGRPHARRTAWLAFYSAHTPGVDCGCESTLRLDLDNEPQPDAFLMILPSHGGQARISEDDCIEGAPELIAEVLRSSASYDLHGKLRACRRNGVREHAAWRALDREIDWFALKGGQYETLPANGSGVQKSVACPGLWLDRAAMIRGDLARALKVLDKGLKSAERRRFAVKLQAKGRAAR